MTIKTGRQRFLNELEIVVGKVRLAVAPLRVELLLQKINVHLLSNKIKPRGNFEQLVQADWRVIPQPSEDVRAVAVVLEHNEPKAPISIDNRALSLTKVHLNVPFAVSILPTWENLKLLYHFYVNFANEETIIVSLNIFYVLVEFIQ